ncbi:MAG: hypothetical protein R6U28_00005, partial [Cyclonatronaceae bacterium]
GHDHVHAVYKNTLIHTGSIMPFNLGELGPKYYWTSDRGLLEIEHKVGSKKSCDFIITTKEIEPQRNKPIIIRKKSVTKEDLVLEKQELNIDILSDFKEKAIEKGRFFQPEPHHRAAAVLQHSHGGPENPQ